MGCVADISPRARGTAGNADNGLRGLVILAPSRGPSALSDNLSV